METFSALLAICAGNSPVPVNSPHKGQWRGALMFSLISVWINGWVNNREAGDLRRNRAHYDIIIMWFDFMDELPDTVSRRNCHVNIIWRSEIRHDVHSFKWHVDTRYYRAQWGPHSLSVVINSQDTNQHVKCRCLSTPNKREKLHFKIYIFLQLISLFFGIVMHVTERAI